VNSADSKPLPPSPKKLRTRAAPAKLPTAEKQPAVAKARSASTAEQSAPVAKTSSGRNVGRPPSTATAVAAKPSAAAAAARPAATASLRSNAASATDVSDESKKVPRSDHYIVKHMCLSRLSIHDSAGP